MKNLLLISNISSDNEQLIEYAAHFCKHYKLKLHILYITPGKAPVLVSSPSNFSNQSILNDEIEHGKNLTNQMSKIVSPILDKEFTQLSVHQGNQEQVLNAFINEHYVDLIMLGTADLEKKTGYANHKDILINIINTPLLVVPENHLFEPLLRLDFLTTHTEKDKQNLLQVIAMIPDSQLTLTHLEMKEDEDVVKSKSKKWVDYVIAKAGKPISYECISSDLRSFIIVENHSFVKRFDAFVFTTHKRKFWARLMDPSTTIGFLTGLELPCIIFKIDK